jgi:hypothetical protein
MVQKKTDDEVANALAIQQARRARGPSARRHFNAHDDDALAELEKMRRATPEELAGPLSESITRVFEPDCQDMHAGLRRRVSGLLARQFAKLIEAYRSEANGLRASRYVAETAMERALADRPADPDALAEWADNVINVFNREKEKK